MDHWKGSILTMSLVLLFPMEIVVLSVSETANIATSRVHQEKIKCPCFTDNWPVLKR